MKAKGFTLVELLVVIAIIGILVALLLPAVQAAREAARRSQCSNQFRQIGLATLLYHDTANQFPSVRTAETHMSWLAQILPYLEQASLRDLIDETQSWSHPANERARSTPVSVFQCPSTGDLLAAYTGGIGDTTAFEDRSLLRAHYIGVMGAKTSCPVNNNVAWPDSGYTMGVVNGNVRCDEPGGQADNGIIVDTGAPGVATGVRSVSISKVTDGTTHTMVAAEQSWLDVGPTRTWIVGVTGTFGWTYNARNVMWSMDVAFREDFGEPNGSSGYANNDSSIGSMHPGGAHILLRGC